MMPKSSRIKAAKSSVKNGSAAVPAIACLPDSFLPDDERALQIRRALLGWYLKHRRTLPWRKARPNAYHVLVSEAMLQQTQVTTVIAYFNRFIEAFPTVQALAQASEQQVLTLWQGLGYYRRARGLHGAAIAIVNEHQGVIPRTVPLLLKLPGVGRYTAGAIASIAYNQPAPIVDGNVARVLARVMGIDQPIDKPDVIKQLWVIAQKLVAAEKDHEGDFNQSMMELGALICTPRSPSCDRCPLASLCIARAQGQTEQIPLRLEKKKPVAAAHHVVAIESSGHWFFQQRPAAGLWSNMWQMPSAQDISPSADDETKSLEQQLMDWLKTSCNLSVGKLKEEGSFVHQTTHRTITFTLWRGNLQGKKPASHSVAKHAPSVWRKLDDLADLPLANPQKRLVKMLQKLASGSCG